MSDQPWRGPRVSSSLRVVVHRDPLATCETCSGDGVFLDENGADHDCPCCEDTYEEPTVAAMAAGLSEALLVDLRAVLGLAREHLREHDREYDHVTSPDLMAMLDRAIEGLRQ